MSKIKKVKFGKDSNRDYLLSIIYENGFIQIYPIENIEGYKELKKTINIGLLKELEDYSGSDDEWLHLVSKELEDTNNGL